MTLCLSLSLVALLVQADVRVKKDAALGFRMPDNWGYEQLINQQKNDNDQFIRSNIDNEQNKRKEDKEPALDMTPFRSLTKGPVQKFQRGVAIQVPLRWNNPHDSSCEINVWVDGMTKVAPLKAPFNCGGGYQDAQFSFMFPKDFPNICTAEAENCVVQMYGHSVEPRTYSFAIDFILTDQATGNGTSPADGQGPKPADDSTLPINQNIPTTQFQVAKLYNDAAHTSHVDSQYSSYQGQQKPLAHVQAACDLQAHVGNGGLVPLGNIDQNQNNDMRNQIQNEIKQRESKKEQEKRQAQQVNNDKAGKSNQPRECVDGAKYGVVDNKNCDRQFTNTYVTDIDYPGILDMFMPKFKEKNMLPYQMLEKDLVCSTPHDEYGEFKVDNKPSTTSGKFTAGIAPPPKGQHIAQAKVGSLKACPGSTSSTVTVADTKPADTKAAEAKPSDTKAADAKPADNTNLTGKGNVSRKTAKAAAAAPQKSDAPAAQFVKPVVTAATGDGHTGSKLEVNNFATTDAAPQKLSTESHYKAADTMQGNNPYVGVAAPPPATVSPPVEAPAAVAPAADSSPAVVPPATAAQAADAAISSPIVPAAPSAQSSPAAFGSISSASAASVSLSFVLMFILFC